MAAIPVQPASGALRIHPPMKLNQRLSPSRLVRAVSSGVAAFFKHDVALQRAEDGVRIVLQERPRSAQLPPREELAARRRQEEHHLMLRQLAGLLNEMPATRRTMRPLVIVERALNKHGLVVLDKLPVDLLQRALEQFEGLVTNWSPVGLATLRSKMAVAIIEREDTEPVSAADAEAEAYRTAALVDSLAPGTGVDIEERDDDEALAAAYAALGVSAPAAVELQGDLGSVSARAVARQSGRSIAAAAAAAAAGASTAARASSDIELREPQG